MESGTQEVEAQYSLPMTPDKDENIQEMGNEYLQNHELLHKRNTVLIKRDNEMDLPPRATKSKTPLLSCEKDYPDVSENMTAKTAENQVMGHEI